MAIKTKSLECFNLLFEVSEAFDDSIETMTESLQSKNAKVKFIQSKFFRLAQMHLLHLFLGFLLGESRKLK